MAEIKKETKNGWITDRTSRNPIHPSPNANTTNTTNNNTNYLLLVISPLTLKPIARPHYYKPSITLNIDTLIVDRSSS